MTSKVQFCDKLKTGFSGTLLPTMPTETEFYILRHGMVNITHCETGMINAIKKVP
jgi:hypothetical protein